MLNLNMAKHLEFTFSTLEMQGVEDQVKCHGDKESHLACFFLKQVNIINKVRRTVTDLKRLKRHNKGSVGSLLESYFEEKL